MYIPVSRACRGSFSDYYQFSNDACHQLELDKKPAGNYLILTIMSGEGREGIFSIQ